MYNYVFIVEAEYFMYIEQVKLADVFIYCPYFGILLERLCGIPVLLKCVANPIHYIAYCLEHDIVLRVSDHHFLVFFSVVQWVSILTEITSNLYMYLIISLVL